MAVGVGFAIVGAGIDRRFQHRIGASALAASILDRAERVEIERHRAGLAEIAAEFGEDRAHFARGAVAVVGQRLDDDADAAGTEALVAHLFVIRAARLLALLDGALDIVLGHVLRRARPASATLSRAFIAGSGSPIFAATVISRASLENSLERFLSCAPLRNWMFLNFEWPAMAPSLLVSGVIGGPRREIKSEAAGEGAQAWL